MSSFDELMRSESKKFLDAHPGRSGDDDPVFVGFDATTFVARALAGLWSDDEPMRGIDDMLAKIKSIEREVHTASAGDHLSSIATRTLLDLLDLFRAVARQSIDEVKKRRES
jgi:hypothetical protein